MRTEAGRDLRRRHGAHPPAAQRSLLCAPGRQEHGPRDVKESLFVPRGPGRRAPCPSALAALPAPPRPGRAAVRPGDAPRSHNAPLLRGKPKWRRAAAKCSVSEAGVRTRALLPTLIPAEGFGVCACACAQGSRRGGRPGSARTRGEAPTGARLLVFSCMKRLAPLK